MAVGALDLARRWALALAAVWLTTGAWAADAAPQRIVSLMPALTEIVCAWGACARLVGVDRDSNHPAQVRTLASMGSGLDPQLEAIVAARPDLVLLSGNPRALQRLRALGLHVEVFELRSHAEVRGATERIGALLRVADAQALWRELTASLDQVARSVPASARGASVYFEVDNGPYAAGATSFIGETLARLGLRNIVSAEQGPFPLLNPEFVVRSDPDFIMVGNGHVQALERRPGWERLRAVRSGRVCLFQGDDADLLVRPGPRLAQAAQVMLRCLHDRTQGRAP